MPPRKVNNYKRRKGIKVDLFIAFGIFVASMLVSVIMGYSMIPPLLVGLAAFLAVGRIRGFSLGSMAVMSKKGIIDSIVVIEVMLVIGLLTAVWRVSGTITVFVYYGMKVILPPTFLIVTFLLCCLLGQEPVVCFLLKFP